MKGEALEGLSNDCDNNQVQPAKKGELEGMSNDYCRILNYVELMVEMVEMLIDYHHNGANQ
jgi:hypothetical protein